MADIPPSSVPKPSVKGMGNALKNPKTLIIVGVLGLAFALYFRSRPSNPAGIQEVPDGYGTPVSDDYYPGATQGANGVDTTGGFMGYDSPDWLTNPPSWLTDPPSWFLNEPSHTNSSDPSSQTVTLAPGQSVYDIGKGALITAPQQSSSPTGGSPPTTGKPGSAQSSVPKVTDRKAQSQFPTHMQGKKENVGQTYVMGYGPNKGDQYTVVKRNGKLFRDYGKGRLLKI